MAILFCVLLVIVGAWFLLNVLLAVIIEALEQIDSLSEKEDQKKKQDLKALKKAHDIVDSEESEQDECPSGRAANESKQANK